MKFGKYLWDKIIHIIVYVTSSVLIVMLLNAFRVNNELITAVIVLLSAAGTVLLFIDFVRKRKFYNNIIHKLEEDLNLLKSVVDSKNTNTTHR